MVVRHELGLHGCVLGGEKGWGVVLDYAGKVLEYGYEYDWIVKPL